MCCPLDGEGNANFYAALSQWEAAQERKREEAAAPRTAPKAPPRENRPPPGLKRLTYMEQREWEQMEEKILAAEQELEARQQEMQAPDVVSDPVRLQDVYARMKAAEEAVDSLYARWAELEDKIT